MTTPAIDYTSRDFNSLRASLLAYAQTVMPEWTPTASSGDFGTLLVEMMAYMGDVLSYYVDRAQNEAYLSTATQLTSVLNIAFMLGYKPGTGLPAACTVGVDNATSNPTLTIPAHFRFATSFVDTLDGPVLFELDPATPGANADGSFTINGTGPVTINLIEGQTVLTQSVGSTSGLQNQTVRIPRANIYNTSVVVYVNGVQWRLVDHLINVGPLDTAYELNQDNNGYTWITFGDGINGALVTAGLPITVTYRYGVGSAGNVPAGFITTIYDSLAGLQLDATSVSTAASGGVDPESIDTIRRNAASSFATRGRLVTLKDYINAAVSVPGIMGANGQAATTTSINIACVGNGASPTNPSVAPSILNNVQTTLTNEAMAGVSVTTISASQVPIYVTDNVTAASFTTTASITSGATVTSLSLSAPTAGFTTAGNSGVLTAGTQITLINPSTVNQVFTVATNTNISAGTIPVVSTTAITNFGSGVAATASNLIPTSVSINTTTAYSNSAVAAQVVNAISSYFASIEANVGGLVTASGLYAAIQTVPGIVGVSLPLMAPTSSSIAAGVNGNVQLHWNEYPVLATNTIGGVANTPALNVIVTGGSA